MTHSYIAYIDESGDDGLAKYRVPGRSGGSSKWLTISATICRLSRDLELVSLRNEIRENLPEKVRHKPIHFKELNHSQRIMASNVLCNKPLRVINIIANKPIIKGGIYIEKNQLYFYLCRFLIERISWFCRDYRPKVPEGDGSVKVIFSRRGGLSYDGFRAYLEKLKSKDDDDIKINWQVIDINSIEAVDHSRKAGLQIADFFAASFTAGLEEDFYGNCEKRYAEILKATVYNRRGNFLSYGMKLYPWADQIPLTTQQRDFIKLFEK